MATTNPEDQLAAAAMRSGSGDAVANLPACMIEDGIQKYVLIRVGDRHLVRGMTSAAYHRDAAKPTVDKLRGLGASYEVLGVRCLVLLKHIRRRVDASQSTTPRKPSRSMASATGSRGPTASPSTTWPPPSSRPTTRRGQFRRATRVTNTAGRRRGAGRGSRSWPGRAARRSRRPACRAFSARRARLGSGGAAASRRSRAGRPQRRSARLS